jgi:hypothetical protein
VRDLETGQTATYYSSALTERTADTEARYAYTGLLGGPGLQRVRDQLEVSVKTA